MIYQIRSFNPLCTSKHYVTTQDALHKRIADIVSATNYMRLSLDPQEAKTHGWENPVNRMDMEMGLEVSTIDEEQFPEWPKFFGDPTDISDPIVKIENGVKFYPKRRELSCANE